MEEEVIQVPSDGIVEEREVRAEVGDVPGARPFSNR